MNVSALLPWDLTPVLTQDRLVALAGVAVATRNRAFAEADREAGDTNWGLACKAHERLMFALAKLTAGGEHPWLQIVREGLYLMPLIEGVPVRLYRGAADRPGSRHLDAVRLEYERSQPAQPQITFGFMGAGGDDGPWYWLMAMETGPAGMVSRVVFVQANDAGETRHPWECPLEAPREQEQVPPPVVRLVDDRAVARRNGALFEALAEVAVASRNGELFPEPLVLTERVVAERVVIAPAPAAELRPQMPGNDGGSTMTMGAPPPDPRSGELFPQVRGEQVAPAKRGRRGARAAGHDAARAVEPRQEELWSTALGAE